MPGWSDGRPFIVPLHEGGLIPFSSSGRQPVDDVDSVSS